jgi:hypothetical protein
MKRGENMSKHHHSNRSQGQNTTSPGGIGKFLGNIDINQLTSLLSSVDINQITSLISKFGKGGQNDDKVSMAVPTDRTFANSPITLNSLQSLGLLNKEELDSLLLRVKEQLHAQRNGENRSVVSEEDFNEV